MLTFFIVMINIAHWIALLVDLMFLAGICAGSAVLSDADVHGRCHQQIEICRSAAFLFSVFYWLTVSCLPVGKCMEGYARLASAARVYGYIWVALGFFAVMTGIIVNIKKKGKGVVSIVWKIRRSCFFMGALFLVIGTILKVN